MRLKFILIQYQWHPNAKFDRQNTIAILSTNNNEFWNNPKCIAFIDSFEYEEAYKETGMYPNGWEIFPGYIKL